VKWLLRNFIVRFTSRVRVDVGRCRPDFYELACITVSYPCFQSQWDHDELTVFCWSIQLSYWLAHESDQKMLHLVREYPWSAERGSGSPLREAVLLVRLARQRQSTWWGSVTGPLNGAAPVVYLVRQCYWSADRGSGMPPGEAVLLVRLARHQQSTWWGSVTGPLIEEAVVHLVRQCCWSA
jgi:hypothetical protein